MLRHSQHRSHGGDRAADVRERFGVRRRMRRRLFFLVSTLCVAFVAVACGRASQKDIDAALGITPTVTLSAGQMSTGTAGAQAAQTAQVAEAGGPGAGGSPA